MTMTRYHSAAPGIGDVLAGRATGRVLERTGNACRRDSFDVGDERCRRFVRLLDQDEQGASLEAAVQFNRIHKQPGARTGPLLERGLDVLRYMWRQGLKNGGLICPSIEQIAADLRMARSTVFRTLAALKVAGFIEWLRRTIEVEDDGAARPGREQTSNLYRLNLPAAAAQVVRQLVWRRKGVHRPPTSMRILDEVELTRRRLDAQIRPGPLAALLKRLAALVAEGEAPGPKTVQS